ncbi:MAG TPA: GNAT family N-acetyltransferase [Thermoplasmata archaeon]|nr:GNAT family N-acetyltransferase [Thermoplasmata archaeon]
MKPRSPDPDGLEAIRTRFDAEMRRDPPLEGDERAERSEHFVRVVGRRAWIAYSHLTASEAPERVAAEARHARSSGVEVEWKLYEYDPPPNLGEILAASGFVADPPETLMVYDLERGRPFPPSGGSVVIRRVQDRTGLETAVAVSRTAFAPEPGWELEEYLPRLASPSLAVFVAEVLGRPASAGRLELPMGRAFASLWGGGTTREFRGRGVYRALVAARADLARARGFRYLTVDARESSRPILERLGFAPVASVVGWVLAP